MSSIVSEFIAVAGIKRPLTGLGRLNKRMRLVTDHVIQHSYTFTTFGDRVSLKRRHTVEEHDVLAKKGRYDVKIENENEKGKEKGEEKEKGEGEEKGEENEKGKEKGEEKESNGLANVKRGRADENNEIVYKKRCGELDTDSSDNIELVIKECPDLSAARRVVPIIGLSPEYWIQYMCGPDPRIWAALDIQRAWRLRRRRRLQNNLEYLNFGGLKIT